MKYSIPACAYGSYTMDTIASGGIHEKETIDYIVANAGTGVVIHAGAGFGDFFPYLKDLPNRILAFEPHIGLYNAALETMAMHNISNIELSPLALSCHVGLDYFTDDGLRSQTGQGKHTRPCTTVDSIVNDPVSLIHLDIEGSEFSALKGAAETINKYSPTVILEIDARAVEYNNFMKNVFNYRPVEQLIHNAGPMVFVNTVYKKHI